MKRLSILFILAFLSYSIGFSINICETCPTNNPMQTFYGDSGDYAFWTDEINWQAVINMDEYSNGSDNFEKFKNARDELYDIGGGVLYYPAGTYTFDIPDSANGEGLLLKRGVVIRGETPSSSEKEAVISRDIDNMGGNDHGLNNMPTQFEFTTKTVQGGTVNKMWNCIGAKKGSNESNLGEVSHVGVAYVEINHGYIWFGFGSSDWSQTWGSDNTSGRYTWLGDKAINGWQDREPDGTHVMDPFCGNTLWGKDTALVGEKRFVFGTLMKNAAIPNYVLPKADWGENQKWEISPQSWRFGAKIGVYGEHLFIANNAISKPTECFLMEYYACSDSGDGDVAGQATVRYDYGNGAGIDVNKQLASGYWNRCTKNHPEAKSLFYAKDVIIQDNFIYNNGHKSIEVAGKWVVVHDNVAPRSHLTWDGDPYGIGAPDVGINPSNNKCHQGESVDDMMSRFMDVGGWNMWIDGNLYKELGTNFANDGEGVLLQRHNGVEAFSYALTSNRKAKNVRGDGGYLGVYDAYAIGFFAAWNKQPGGIGVLKGGQNYGQDISVPESINWDLDGNPTPPDGTGGSEIQDFLSSCSSIDITEADTVINLNVTFNETEYKTTITYEDNTDNEMAYRIEKKRAGTNDPWTVVAYRPRQETVSSEILDSLYTDANYGPTPHDQCFPSISLNDLNKPKWIDYKTNSEEAFEYRVVAIDCDNNDLGSSSSKTINKSYEGTEISKPVTVPKFSIRPNPVNTNAEVSYSLKEDETATVELMDMSGKRIEVLAHNTKQSTVRIPNDIAASGTYLVKVQLSSGGATVKKLVIQ